MYVRLKSCLAAADAFADLFRSGEFLPIRIFSAAAGGNALPGTGALIAAIAAAVCLLLLFALAVFFVVRARRVKLPAERENTEDETVEFSEGEPPRSSVPRQGYVPKIETGDDISASKKSAGGEARADVTEDFSEFDGLDFCEDFWREQEKK